MKTLYIECAMGAAGDMLTAALLELRGDAAGFVEKMNSLCLPGVRVAAEQSVKCGVAGTHISVTVHGKEESDEREHGHSTLGDIERLIRAMPLPEKVKSNALAVYALLADAESHVHGCAVENIHFHEVGTLDALADILGACLLMYDIAPERVVVSPVHVGGGHVRCAHGVLPVPAPATAYLLRGAPVYGGEIAGELCTPTGAALLKRFADSFGAMPQMTLTATGYGMGKKDFTMANCVRAFLGEASDEDDSVAELRCNLDDMTPEALAFAQEMLLENGALDVYTAPIGMKKARPAVMLCCLCKREQAKRFALLMLKYTTTLGVRESVCRRYVLPREEMTVATELGDVRVKSARGDGYVKSKPEFEDIAKIARRTGLSPAQVIKRLGL